MYIIIGLYFNNKIMVKKSIFWKIIIIILLIITVLLYINRDMVIKKASFSDNCPCWTSNKNLCYSTPCPWQKLPDFWF